jgi:hypothetical protein
VAVPDRALIRGFAASGARAVAIAAIAASVLATGAFALGLLRVRPLIPGEAEILFEASRIRQGFALYVDPLVGEFDYGPVPTRCYVLYPPLWSWVLAHVPATFAATIARVTCTLAWFGSLAWVASRARPECRRAAWLAAGAVAGVFVLALFATSGRPDALATAVAGVALSRAAARGRVGATEGAVLALAAWMKPNVIGIAAGLGVYALARGPVFAGAFVAGAACVSLPLAAVLQRASGGAWVHHLVGSVVQPLSLAIWWTHVSTRAMFLAPAALTTWLGARDRTPGARIATFAWCASLAWALFSLAKAGSASNYWMEPAMAAVAIFANAPGRTLDPGRRALFWIAAAGACAWLAVASIGGVLEAFEREPRRAALLSRARVDCRARDGEVVVTDNSGGEFALNGRVIEPAFQMIFLVHSGRLPLGTWVADVRRPEVACALEQDGVLHAVREIGAAIDERMVEVERVEDWRLYGLRDRRSW